MLESFVSIIKAVCNAIKNVFLAIRNAVACAGGFFVGIFVFIKNLIDIVYRILFIAFFCVLAYVGYKVYSSAGSINKKLNEIQNTVSYISKLTEDFSKSADKISKVSGEMTKATEKASGLTKKIKNFF